MVPCSSCSSSTGASPLTRMKIAASFGSRNSAVREDDATTLAFDRIEITGQLADRDDQNITLPHHEGLRGVPVAFRVHVLCSFRSWLHISVGVPAAHIHGRNDVRFDRRL